MTPEEKKKRREELVLYMVVRHIPFNPPLSQAALERMRKMNPKDYALLEEYMELTEDERK